MKKALITLNVLNALLGTTIHFLQLYEQVNKVKATSTTTETNPDTQTA